MAAPHDTTRTRRVRPVTWAILAFMLIAIAAILGAWQGSESRYGAVPEIIASSDSGRVTVLPYEATDLDGNSYTNPIPTIELNDDQHLSLTLPVELHRSQVQVFEVREFGETTTDLDHPDSILSFPVTTEQGRLTGVAITAVAGVYSHDGSESIMQGEWAISVAPVEQ